MPALITHGGRGQAALVSAIGGKIGNTIRKRHGLGFWDFQTSQESKPVLSCSNEEFARPPQTIHSLPLVLLASPTIGGEVDDRRLNYLAARDVEVLGDNQKLLSIALQGCVGHALAGAMVQKLFSGFCKSPSLMSSDD